MEKHFLLLLGMGWLLGGHFGSSLRWGRGPCPVRKVMLLFGPRQRSGGCWGSGRRSLQGRFPFKRGYPGVMLNKVDIGAFPSNRWYWVTIMPWPSGGLALRAAQQAVRKARCSLPSSSIASASRCWMSLARDCWAEWALEALLDSPP